MQILYNANICTLDQTNPIASAIVIDYGQVLTIGNDDKILAEFEGRGEPKNMDGLTMIPGLTDAHIHLKSYALGLSKVDCETSTKQECLQRIAERAKHIPSGQWILGHGWNQNDWPEGFGNAFNLDSVASHHPVYLTAKSLHASWANTNALQQAGINPKTASPKGGIIQRDERGNPNGILFEEAMSLISSVIPEPTPGQVAENIMEAQTQLWQMGLTGVHDFDCQLSFKALQTLHTNGELGLHVVKSLPIEDINHAVAMGIYTGFGDDFLRIGAIKAFADGALGPRTASMLQPYEGEPENRGMLMMDTEELFEQGRLAVENGLSLAIHAIGDHANHEVLNAITQLRAYENRELFVGSIDSSKPGTSSIRQTAWEKPLRHRIEHVQIIHPDDAARLAELDIIASMQPIHATSDYPAANRYWGDRAVNSYIWRNLQKLSTRLVFGSDAPVESPNPFWGLHAAVTRRRHDGTPGPDGWYPAQRLNLVDALHAYTTGPAYAAGMEHRLGKLRPGYLADLLVLDTDLFTCKPEEIIGVRPLATMVGGKWVYTELE